MGEDAPESGNEHYFTERPTSASRPRELRFLYRGEVLAFEADAGVFASHGLDPGTALLIEHLSLAPEEYVLDLGCGWGAIGVACAKAAPKGRVFLTDLNRRAVRLARRNVVRNHLPNAQVRPGDGFGSVEAERFSLIATNPPYHLGREWMLKLLEAVPEHLAPEGRLLLVGKGSQGIRFYQEWLAQHWDPGVEVLGRRSGYRVLEARPKRDARQA
ncbi:MAG: methyltransferase [Thermoplasmata archaeon]|nr:methyltransferase [Thermoplasmata archaeon]